MMRSMATTVVMMVMLMWDIRVATSAIRFGSLGKTLASRHSGCTV